MNARSSFSETKNRTEPCLKVQTICITGASSGIGLLALKFAQAGHSLYLGARRLDRLENIKNRCHRAKPWKSKL